MRRFLLAAALLLASCVAANDGEQSAPAPAPAPKTLAQLEAEINAEIGTPRAENAGQCRAIAFGVKPCGGPWKYLIYSTAAGNETRLRQLVDEYNAAERKLNEAEGRMSDCMGVLEPEVAVANGVCVARRRPR